MRIDIPPRCSIIGGADAPADASPLYAARGALCDDDEQFESSAADRTGVDLQHPPWRGRRRPLGFTRIADVIKDTAPDLVALQEVDEATARSGGVKQASELGRLTGLQAVFGQATPFQGGGYGVGILSRYPVLSVVNHPLPVAPDREPRTTLSVTLQPAAGVPSLVFTSTHLDFGGVEHECRHAVSFEDVAWH